MGTVKHKIASQNRWKDISKEERSKRMSLLAKKRHAKMTPEQKQAMLAKLNQAKQNRT